MNSDSMVVPCLSLFLECSVCSHYEDSLVALLILMQPSARLHFVGSVGV